MPGVLLVVGVHANVSETGDVPWTVVNFAPEGRLLADRVRVNAVLDGFVAFTENVSFDV